MKLEYHRLATVIVIYSGKNHQWVLKQLDESLLRNRIFTQSQCNSLQNIYHLKRHKSNFTVERACRYSLSTMLSKLKSPGMGQIDFVHPLMLNTENTVYLL